MDTRSKIVNEQRAREIQSSGATVVSGYFDPLVASHAERLKELKQERMPLLILISTPPHPILAARARAELVAGLSAVDYVTEAASGLTPQIRLEREDEIRLKNLIAHVHARQQAAS